MHTTILAAAVGAVILQILLSLIRQLRSPLYRVGGPFLARYSSVWYALTVWKGSFPDVNVKLHEKYGKIARYAPNRYSINDPESAKTIYGLGKSFPKSSWYTSWSIPGEWNLFADQSIQRHSQMRKLYQAPYAMSALVNYEPFVDECAALFKHRLSELTSTNMAVDMRHWFQCYAFDVIGKITYGKRIGFLDQGDDVMGVIRVLESTIDYSTMVGIYPFLHRYLFHIRSWLDGTRSTGRGFMIDFTIQRIKDAHPESKAASESKDMSAPADFLSKFMTKHSNDPDNFTDFHVLSGCLANMVAGSDTTAISLSAILYYLLKNPCSMKTLQEQIDEHSASGRLSDFPTFKESQEMPYLQAVIKEALRLHPATGLPLERVVSEGGATISGHFFPEGSIVGINTWVAHRNKTIFGDDAEYFSPERWLKGDPHKIAAMNRYWMPFGLGSRTCIGRHVSMLEMCKLIPLLIRDFTFTLDESLVSSEWHTRTHWFTKPMDFKVKIQPREGASSKGRKALD
ncbi:cytochrome P450 [Stachybotrys elegans]|uniref:Cytochrome P450 n=1 Tax=Stachybotrys elegans TaxID=80388 RepID=A0A8K0SPF8_9HYPO|nr:cytochrome P450 [Stachybotrys elegans]